MLVPFSISYVVVLVAMNPYIAWLNRQQIGQYLREDGPASHAVKARTPTMGGACFIPAVSLTAAAWLIFSKSADLTGMAVLAIGVACGAIGFADDFAKLRSQSNKGVSGHVRLATEFGLGAILAGIVLAAGMTPAVYLPHAFIDILPSSSTAAHGFAVLQLHPVLFVILSAFLIAATTNSVNLHDGMDGLAAGTSAQIFALTAIMCAMTGQYSLVAIAAACAAGLVAFLHYNKYPARVFMGDTGSLFVGGMLGALVAVGGLVFWFVPLALIYILEALSVMAQVVYFKLTKDYKPEKPMSQPALIIMKLTKRLPGEGRRLFRMAPLHHHFEAVYADKGVKEWQVVMGFWLVQLVLCLGVLAGFIASRAG